MGKVKQGKVNRSIGKVKLSMGKVRKSRVMRCYVF